MEERIEKYMESVFRDVPDSDRASTIRKEITQNLLDKYHDLLQEGKSEEEAYAIAISCGGDLSGIVADLRGENVPYSYNYEKQFDRLYEKQLRREKKSCARFGSVLWLVTVCVYLLVSFLVPGVWAYSWVLFVLAAAVDNFYRFVKIRSQQSMRRNALYSTVWMGTIAVYFLSSFLLNLWAFSWILFIVAFALTRILGIVVFHDDTQEDEDENEDGKGKK